jgi:hypothetical protein
MKTLFFIILFSAVCYGQYTPIYQLVQELPESTKSGNIVLLASDTTYYYDSGLGWVTWGRKPSGGIINMTSASSLPQDATHRYVTDSQIASWNAGGGGVETFFELDGNGDIQPKTSVTSDTYFELDGNSDIEPK